MRPRVPQRRRFTSGPLIEVVLDPGVLSLRRQDRPDDLLGCLLAQVDGVPVLVGREHTRALEILPGDPQ
jgi:hypothetical protein